MRARVTFVTSVPDVIGVPHMLTSLGAVVCEALHDKELIVHEFTIEEEDA